MPPRNEAAAEEKRRREEEKKAFKAAQELDSLKRCFKRIDKNNDGSIDVPELMQEVREDQQNSIAKHLALVNSSLSTRSIARFPLPRLFFYLLFLSFSSLIKLTKLSCMCTSLSSLCSSNSLATP